jgi:hypothetical protein
MIREIGLKSRFDHERVDDLRMTATKDDTIDAGSILSETKSKRGLPNIFEDISEVCRAFGDLREGKGGDREREGVRRSVIDRR